MKLLFFVSLLVFANCSTSNLETVENKDENGRVVERFTRLKKDFAKEGRYQAFYPNGTTREDAFYRHDTLDGERKLFYPNGTCELIERRQLGSFEGKFQNFYENGTLKSEGEYRNNSMTGKWRFLYKNGQPKEFVMFKDNEENGPFQEFYMDGRLKTEGNYKNGDAEDGELRMYDSLGMLLKIMDCDGGRCRTKWERGQ